MIEEYYSNNTAFGFGLEVGEGAAAFANSAAANTGVNVDVAKAERSPKDGNYALAVTNPSTETALTVKCYVRETFGVNVRWALAATVNVPANTPGGTSSRVFLVGEAFRFTVSNDTVLGVAGAFTSELRLRKP